MLTDGALEETEHLLVSLVEAVADNSTWPMKQEGSISFDEWMYLLKKVVRI
jgi:hypothetical protein